MATVVRFLQVLVADAVGGEHERLDERPGAGPVEAVRGDADVEVAPDHQAGDEAADEQDAAGAREPRLDVVLVEEGACLSVKLRLAGDEFVSGAHRLIVPRRA